MQIASMTPLYVRASEMSEADVAKQREIFAGQMEEEARETGKSRPPRPPSEDPRGQDRQVEEGELPPRAGAP
jgi:hypothetical protein